MAELLYSIKRVFSNYLNDKSYYIPEYQRGYKWSKQQVEQLLDDIYKFSLTRDEDHFYCLQNITLFQNLENEKYINVVDGQQRLTTTTLLLSYLKCNDLISGKLIYAVRDSSNKFLQEIIDNQSDLIDLILDSINFEVFIDSYGKYYDFQDVYHMYEALKAIDNWFKNRKRFINKQTFKDILLNHVKLIVNKVSQVSEQELFMNLNAGKVHLDGSDLIRAILITRVAKLELENYDSKDVEDILKLHQRRTRIGWELDEMNNWWNRKDVKAFFQNFTSIKTAVKETIKFNQDIHPINLLYKIWVEIKGENDINLYTFEKRDALTTYQSILHIHRVLKDWFEDRKIYHYLGYLFSNSNIKIKTVFDFWNNKEYTRSKFVDEWCVEQIKLAVFPNQEKDNENSGYGFWMNKVLDFNSDDPTNWYETTNTQQILILLDIIEHSHPKEKGNPLPFLNPRYFRNFKEDKEHIFSSTPRELKEIKDLDNPIEKLNEYINSLNIGYEEAKKIPKFKYDQSMWETLSDENKSLSLNELKTLIHKSRPINSLGNIVLLHLTINRGFGNSEYSLKRANVINNTINGLYVRQNTINAFIKSTSSENLNNWTLKDVENNARNIHKALETFFNLNLNG
ncbi:DUF262 domain-containing protein [Sphingobacterium kyonggiense]